MRWSSALEVDDYGSNGRFVQGDAAASGAWKLQRKARVAIRVQGAHFISDQHNSSTNMQIYNIYTL